VRKSRKADEFSLQPLIKEFAKGKTQHVISMESRDHGPNGRTGTRIGMGRTAAGRAGSFNLEEHRSSRSEGPKGRNSLRKPGPGALDHRGGFGGAPRAASRTRRSPARRRGAHRRRKTRHAGGVSYVRTGGGDAPVPQHLGHCRFVSPAVEHFPGPAPADAV
jgi:hypothetical protein